MSDTDTNAPSVVLIDELALDKECIRLPGDYLKYSHRSADAKRMVDELENRLKVASAELARDIRSAPEDYGIDKLTEAALQAAVIAHPRYQKNITALQEAQHEARLAEAVVWALEHKKRSLTLLVELHGMGYFAAPKISRQGREAVEEMTKKNVRRSSMHED